MKTLVIRRESWWDSNGCSCCEPTEMPYYDVYLDGERVMNYTPLSREDALEMFLETLGYEVQDEDGEL